ncbi:hypothetical protein [Leptospira sp. 'Mane']|uniref:DUF4376 domain-containing protein n=1 Tax=Leptospira sp. 'Mane' TaxID=3387407 RepID=UPI00398B6D59
MKIFCYNDSGIKYESDKKEDFQIFRVQAINENLQAIESEFFPFKTNENKSIVKDDGGNHIRLTDIEIFQKGYISLADLKTVLEVKAKAKCSQLIVSGFTSLALGSPYKYDSNMEDQSNLLANVARNTSVKHKCTNANGITFLMDHTAEQIKQVLEDGSVRKTEILTRYRELVNQIASASESSIQSIDITIEWGD